MSNRLWFEVESVFSVKTRYEASRPTDEFLPVYVSVRYLFLVFSEVASTTVVVGGFSHLTCPVRRPYLRIGRFTPQANRDQNQSVRHIHPN